MARSRIHRRLSCRLVLAIVTLLVAGCGNAAPTIPPLSTPPHSLAVNTTIRPSPTSSPTSRPTGAAFTVSSRQISRAAPDGSWSVEFTTPLVSGPSPASSAAINPALTAQVDAFIAEVPVPPAVLPGDLPSSVRGSFVVGHLTASLVSLRLSSLNYETGTNHGVEHVAGLTFTADGTRIHLGDLFSDTSAGLAALRTESQALLASDHVELLNDPSALPLTSFDEGWMLTPDGLSLSWSQGDIAPMAAGVVEVTIPWSLVADVVRRDGPAGEFFK